MKEFEETSHFNNNTWATELCLVEGRYLKDETYLDQLLSPNYVYVLSFVEIVRAVFEIPITNTFIHLERNIQEWLV